MINRPLGTLNDGAIALLEHTITVLQNFPDYRYIIIGGWCPVLRNTSDLAHPGTIDVDILFEDSHLCGNLSPIVKSLISEGFMPSAKHSFQLLKPFEINNSRVVFHIDLLHPDMINDRDSVDMFVDHLDLDIPISQEEDRAKTLASIVLPNSRVLFDEELFDDYPMGETEFSLITFEGMFLTKMDSCRSAKRKRDSFDIYLAFVNEAVDVSRIKQLASRYSGIEQSLHLFAEHLVAKSTIFDENVRQYSDSVDQSPSQYILAKLEN